MEHEHKISKKRTETLIEEGSIEQNDLNRYLEEQMYSGIDLTGSAIFKKALKLCTDDDLLYRIAFYLEVLRNTGSDAVRTYLAERMEEAGMEIPDGFIYQDMYEE